MEERSRRPGSLLLLLVGLALLCLVALPFVPLFPCYYCSRERQEIHDWMRVVPREYIEKHPEAITAARKDLDRLNERCRSCFHGRVSLVKVLF